MQTWKTEDNRKAWQQVLANLLSRYEAKTLMAHFNISTTSVIDRWASGESTPFIAYKVLFERLDVDTTALLFSTSGKIGRRAVGHKTKPRATAAPVEAVAPAAARALRLNDMFQLAAVMMPMSDRQAVFVDTVMQLREFAAKHNLTLLAVLDILKE